MDFNKEEVVAVEQASKNLTEQEVRMLNDLQLSMIGGGIGDVVWG
jgi:hypothetical protein